MYSSVFFKYPFPIPLKHNSEDKKQIEEFLINIPLFLFFQLQCYLEFVQIYFCFTSQSWSIKLPNKIDPATSLQLAAANLVIIDPVPKYSRPTKSKHLKGQL